MSRPRARSGLPRAPLLRPQRPLVHDSYHTQFPQYVRKRVPIPENWSYAFLRHHHRMRGARSSRRSISAAISSRTASRTSCSGRAASTPSCSSRAAAALLAVRRPIWMYAGRVAVEKNLDAFLSLDLPGTKVVVGDGPDRPCSSAGIRPRVFPGFVRPRARGSPVSRRRVRVPEPHGHVRARDARGDGVRYARRRLSVTGPIDVVRPA